MREVNADLVSAPSLELTQSQDSPFQPPQHPDMSHGATSIRSNLHSEREGRISTNIGFDRKLIHLGLLPNDGHIVSIHALGSDLSRQFPVSRVVLCNHHQAGRIFVESMDDSRPKA